MAEAVGTWSLHQLVVDDHNPDHIESKTLNTEMETLAPEATAEIDGLSTESTPTTATETNVPTSSALSEDPHPATSPSPSPHPRKRPPSRFQAAGGIAGTGLRRPDFVLRWPTSTANKLSKPPPRRTSPRKKSSSPNGSQDHRQACRGRHRLQVRGRFRSTRCSTPMAFCSRPGDSIEVVVEREETTGGGYAVSHEKALRHKVWDKLEEAANTKTPVKGMVVSRQGRPRLSTSASRHSRPPADRSPSRPPQS